jgi:translation initiation factor IF-3
MTNYRRKKKPQKDTGKKYRINRRIEADEVRVVDDEGGMLGILSRSEALRVAEEKERDLVEINPKANPPVVKIIDFNKFKYQQAKSEANKPKKTKEMKTIRVSVRVSVHDMAVRAKKIDEFLDKGIKVKIQVQMKGRERSHPEVAKEAIEQLIGMVTEEFVYENEPKLIADSYFSTIKPKK